MNEKNLNFSENYISLEDFSDYQLDQIGNNKKILEFNSQNPDLLSKLEKNECTIISVNQEHEFINENDALLNIPNAKFDVILLNNLLEYIKNPDIFFKKINNLLSENGYIICIVQNISHISKRLQSLDGSFDSIQMFGKNQINFFTLDTLSLTLTNSDFSITDLKRVEQNLDLKNSNVKSFNLPQEFLDSLMKDPESTTTHYIFRAIPTNVNNKFIREYLLKFPKGFVTESISNYYNYYKEHLVKVFEEREIDYQKKISKLEQVISDKEKIVNEKEKIVNEKEKIVNEKEKIVNEKDQSIKEYQVQINKIHNSMTWKILKKLDKLRGKTQ